MIQSGKPARRLSHTFHPALRLEVHLRPVEQDVRIATLGGYPVQEIGDEIGRRLLQNVASTALQLWVRSGITPVFRQGRRLSPADLTAVHIQGS